MCVHSPTSLSSMYGDNTLWHENNKCVCIPRPHSLPCTTTIHCDTKTPNVCAFPDLTLFHVRRQYIVTRKPQMCVYCVTSMRRISKVPLIIQVLVRDNNSLHWSVVWTLYQTLYSGQLCMPLFFYISLAILQILFIDAHLIQFHKLYIHVEQN